MRKLSFFCAAVVASTLGLAAGAAPARADEGPEVVGPPREGEVVVHVKKTPALGERADFFAPGPDGKYAWVCTAPCNTVLPVSSRVAVRVDGTDEPAHAVIRKKYGSEVDLAIAPRSHTGQAVGWIFLGTGIAATAAGIGTIVGFASMDQSSGNRDRVILPPAALGVIVGVPVTLLGLVLGGIGGGILGASSSAPAVEISPRGGSAQR